MKKRSVLKAQRRHERRTQHHKTYRTRVKNLLAKFKATLAQKDFILAKEMLKLIFSVIDKGVKKGVWHKNTGSRKKSKAALLLNKAISQHGANSGG